MPIRLVKPAHLGFHPAGAGVRFADGSEMRPNASDEWWLSDAQAHQLTGLLSRGWKEWKPEQPKRIFKDECERIAIEKPLSLNEILKLCEAENIKIRVNAGVLQIKGAYGGDPTQQLRAHLEVRRIELRNFLERLQATEWRDV